MRPAESPSIRPRPPCVDMANLCESKLNRSTWWWMSVGSLLAKLQLTPQYPLQQAYQRDPEAIALWQQQTYPALARQAKRDSAQILFWDE